MSGDEIQEANLVYIVDAAPTDADPKRLKSIERTKAAKKRVKKIKTRMAQVWQSLLRKFKSDFAFLNKKGKKRLVQGREVARNQIIWRGANQ